MEVFTDKIYERIFKPMHFILFILLLFPPFTQKALGTGIESDNPCASLLRDLSIGDQAAHKMLRAKEVLTNFSKGLDSEDIIAYHGAAIETLEIFIKTGRWPGSNMPGYGNNMFTFGIKEQIKIDPKLAGAVKNKISNNVFLDEETALRAASSYANQVAGGIALLEELGQPVNTESYQMAIDYIDPTSSDKAVSYFQKKLKIDPKKLKTALGIALKRKGVVIGIHKRILQHSAISAKQKSRKKSHGSEFDDGLIFDITDLSSEDIGGIEPLGKYEMQWFEALEKHLTRN